MNLGGIMEVALVGLGAMGVRMAGRLVDDHRVVAFDVDQDSLDRVAALGAVPAADLEDVVAKLSAPRVVWLMLPAGQSTESTIDHLVDLLQEADLVVDGGNSHYRDSIRRASSLQARGINFLDVGTSGGMAGGDRGFSLMVGGAEDIVRRLEPVFRRLAAEPDESWGRVGPAGAGHFAKMVHNGMEYGLIRAYAQGLSALEAKKELEFDLRAVTGIWRGGAMARSAILDLTHEALTANPELGSMAPYVADAGKDRWTTGEAIDQIAQRGFDKDQFA